MLAALSWRRSRARQLLRACTPPRTRRRASPAWLRRWDVRAARMPRVEEAQHTPALVHVRMTPRRQHKHTTDRVCACAPGKEQTALVVRARLGIIAVESSGASDAGGAACPPCPAAPRTSTSRLRRHSRAGSLAADARGRDACHGAGMCGAGFAAPPAMPCLALCAHVAFSSDTCAESRARRPWGFCSAPANPHKAAAARCGQRLRADGAWC